MPDQLTRHDPPDTAMTPAGANGTTSAGWPGPTYYGRSQLKAAPFGIWVSAATSSVRDWRVRRR